jgi:hypothetical protein
MRIVRETYAVILNGNTRKTSVGIECYRDE